MHTDAGAVDPAALRSGRSLKWTAYPPDVLPLWVADMDFPAADVITEAMSGMLATGFLGYPDRDLAKSYVGALRSHLAREFDVDVDHDAVVIVTDLVQAMRAAIIANSSPGDEVALLTPAYPPFQAAIVDTGRVPAAVPIEISADGYVLDIDRLERVLASEGVRVFLLCNPHNPTGYVLQQDEVDRIVAACARHGVVLISDEVHADFVYAPEVHVAACTSRLGSDGDVITLYSATKSFNIAGTRSAVMLMNSAALRRRFDAVFPARVLGSVSTLSLIASIAAWAEGGEWLARTRAQLTSNRELLAAWMRRNHALVQGVPPQGTYFQWFRFPLPDDWRGTAAQLILDRHRVALSDGVEFGADREWVRLNFATSTSILDDALTRIAP